MKKILLNVFNILIALIFLGLLSSCDKEVSVTPPEPPPPTGKLFVDSDPQGAFIYLNGKNTGNITPDTIEWLEENEYQLTFKKRLFKDYSVTVRVKKDSLTTYFLDYHTVNGINGRMIVDSDPRGVEIFLNGVSTGQYTQTTIENLFPGMYNVKFKLAGYWDDSVSVEVRSDHTARPYITLIDSLVWVNFKESNSGLPENFINHLAIENGGIKWIATLSSGVVRYDDRIWTVYDVTNSPLPENNIRYIVVDEQGKKWICTVAGLAIFDDVSWTVYNSSNSGLPVDDINCVAVASNGDAWIGTAGGGVVLFDGVNWTVYNTTNSHLRSNDIRTIAIDNQDNKWIGTYNEGIAKYNGQFWRNYVSFKSGVSKNANHIAIDLNNIPWVSINYVEGLPGGSAFFSDPFWETFSGLPSDNVLYVAVDSHNYKWFGNSEAGLSRYTGSMWTHFTTENSRLPNDRVFAIAFDGAGNKWIATFGGGLVKYKGN